MLLLTSALLLALLASAYFLLAPVLRPKHSLPLPPGPKPLPLIGNVHQLPTSHEHLTFSAWAKDYGNIICATVFGKPMIVLNGQKEVVDLLEKRAALYHGRPSMVMAGELVGFEESVALTSDANLHRQYRRLFNQALNPRAAQEYWPSQLRESREMMARLLDEPDKLVDHIKRTVVAVIFLVSHGYQITSNDDYYIWLGNKVMVNFAKAATPGAWLVDFLPFLKYIPAWFPGAQFQRDAALWRSEWFELLEKPYNMVKANMAAGTARPSFVSKLAEEATSLEEERTILWAGGSLYSAGADTTVSAIHTFYLAMLLHPTIQKRAQEEIDTVVGHDRMPTFEDWERLPYCYAIVKEVLRWRPVAPLAIPHTCSQDDTYEGYSIPKGSMVIGSIWALNNDPNVYTNPDAFDPTRFLSLDGTKTQNPAGCVRDIGSFCFGFGRRICPGANLAEASLFIAVVNTLWTFDVDYALDGEGKRVEPDMEYVSGVVSHPKDFQCSIKPRSPAHADLVRHAVAEYVSH